MPDEIPEVEKLIADHKEFMENTARRQPEVDRACKPKAPPAGTKEPAARKQSRQLKTPVYVHLFHFIFFSVSTLLNCISTYVFSQLLHFCPNPNMFASEQTHTIYPSTFQNT